MATTEISLRDEVKQLLEENYPGSHVAVDHFFGAKRLNGHIVWSGFTGLDSVDRHQKLNQLLRQELGKKKSDEISIILAYTPREWEIAGED